MATGGHYGYIRTLSVNYPYFDLIRPGRGIVHVLQSFETDREREYTCNDKESISSRTRYSRFDVYDIQAMGDDQDLETRHF